MLFYYVIKDSYVIPTKTGIHSLNVGKMDPRFREGDRSLTLVPKLQLGNAIRLEAPASTPSSPPFTKRDLGGFLFQGHISL